MSRLLHRVVLLSLSFAAVSFLTTETIVFSQTDNTPARTPVEKLATELVAVKTDEERQNLLQQNKERVTTDLVRELNKQGRTYFSQSKYPQALETYEVGLNIAKSIDDKAGVSLISIGVGNAFYVQGNYPKALEAYEQSLKFAEAANNRSDIARAWGSIGTLQWAQGNYQTALDLMLKSLKVRRELNDKAGISTSLGNIAGIYYLQGNYDQALEYQLQGLKLSEESNDKAGISVALNNIGAVYLIQGNYLRALETLQRSLKMKEELADKPSIVSTLSLMGQVYYENGNEEQALATYQKGLELAREIGNKPGMAAILSNTGNVYYSQHDFAKALPTMQEALKLNRELGEKASVAGSLNNIANVYKDQADYKQALEYLEESKKIADEMGYARVSASSLVNIAQIYEAQGQYQQAWDYAMKGTTISRQSDNSSILWQALTTLGHAQEGLKQFGPARESFLEAISIVEKLREQAAGGEQDQQRFFETKVSPYYAMVNLSIKQQDFGQALVFAERAKGRVLLDVLSNGKVNISKAMTPAEVAQDQTLRSEVNALNTRVARLKARSPSSPEVSATVTRLEKARLDYESFQTNLYGAHPELKVQRGKAPTLTLAEATKLLPDDRTALLEYVVGDDNTYLFVLTKAGALKLYTLNIQQKELRETSEAFRKQLAERNLAIKTPARRLYELLLSPAEAQLKGVTKLVIVPDGPLWDLPFQALHRGPRGYLLEDYAISYAPSLSVLRDMNAKAAALSSKSTRPQSVHPELFAIGNPNLNRETTTRVSALRSEETLEPLPDAEREVNTLKQLYGNDRSKVLIGEQATEEEVKREAGKYSLLHFATHAILDDQNPMYSRLMLASATGDTREDGLLEAWEVMNLDLSAATVVLSACQTARGRFGIGEGMIGMSWAMFVAGSPAVVVSQWKVDSARTTDLMVEFHRNLLRGKSKSEALQLAAKKLLRGNYNHPAYWAGFVLIGSER
ncbi:MAG TPA: CHAT domain-containing protein [Pyrinomonadaceae bacterium]|nr:CHAT domain-containing protein [Pyrinomonadaceae bacterium]